MKAAATSRCAPGGLCRRDTREQKAPLRRVPDK